MVRLSPICINKPEVEISSERKPGSDTLSVVKCEGPTTSTFKKIFLPVCVPVSKNPHCSLIMNISDHSNDVTIEHTCESRGIAGYKSLLNAEDPSNIVFEILTSLLYKVECLEDSSKTSCYEHLIEEYSGEKYSDVLFQSLSSEEKYALKKIREAPPDKSFLIRRENYIEPYLSLPIKKRIFNQCWNRNQLSQSDPGAHSLSVDFTKIGKEVVLVKKLRESDFSDQRNSLKAVSSPLSLDLQASNRLSGNLKNKNSNSKPMSPAPKKDFKTTSKKKSKLKNVCDIKYLMSDSSVDQTSCKSLSKQRNSNEDSKKSGNSPLGSNNNESSSHSSDIKIIYENTDSKSTFSDISAKSLHCDTDSKSNSGSSVSKISHCSPNSNMALDESNSESINITDNFEPEIIPDNLDFLFLPKSVDNLINEKNANSKTATISSKSEVISVKKNSCTAHRTNSDIAKFKVTGVNDLFESENMIASGDSEKITSKTFDKRTKKSSDKNAAKKSDEDVANTFGENLTRNANSKSTTMSSKSKLTSVKRSSKTPHNQNNSNIVECKTTGDNYSSKGGNKTSSHGNKKITSKKSDIDYTSHKNTESICQSSKKNVPRNDNSKIVTISSKLKITSVNNGSKIAHGRTNYDTAECKAAGGDNFSEAGDKISSSDNEKNISKKSGKNGAKHSGRNMANSSGENIPRNVNSKTMTVSSKSKLSSGKKDSKIAHSRTSSDIAKCKATDDNYVSVAGNKIASDDGKNIASKKSDKCSENRSDKNAEKMSESSGENVPRNVNSKTATISSKSKLTSVKSSSKIAHSRTNSPIAECQATGDNYLSEIEIKISPCDNKKITSTTSSRLKLSSETSHSRINSHIAEYNATGDYDAKDKISSCDHGMITSKKYDINGEKYSDGDIGNSSGENVPKNGNCKSTTVSSKLNLSSVKRDSKIAHSGTNSNIAECEVAGDNYFSETGNKAASCNSERITSKKSDDCVKNSSDKSAKKCPDGDVAKSSGVNVSNKSDKNVANNLYKSVLHSSDENDADSAYENANDSADDYASAGCYENIASTSDIAENYYGGKHAARSCNKIFTNNTVENQAPKNSGDGAVSNCDKSNRGSCVESASNNFQENIAYSSGDNAINNSNIETVSYKNNIKNVTPVLDFEKPLFAVTEDNKSDDKIPMSELRLYRRKKELLMKEKQRNISAKNEMRYDLSNLHANRNASLDLSFHERCFDMQVDSGAISTSETDDFEPIGGPVVELEPCKDLIEKYCKRETDTDCLILKEVSHKQKAPPTVKEKRFFRSRAEPQKVHSLTSNTVISHKLGTNGSKCKSNIFHPIKQSRHNSVSNVPTVGKRSAEFELPGPKKIHPAKHFKCTSKKSSIEQVYDFDSHLNSSENDDNSYFSRFTMKNKSFCNIIKKNVSSKLSLKSNRRRSYEAEAQDDYIPECEVSIDTNSEKVVRPRRKSSVVSYNEEEETSLEKNRALPERFNYSYDEDIESFHDSENSTPEDRNSDAESDWFIDTAQFSQVRAHGDLKCTISKKKTSSTSHNSEKLPIPKFKVRKKKRSNSLNVSIKLRKSSVEFLDDDADFKKEGKNSYYISSPKKKSSKKSKKKSRTFTSAFDVKQKYKKHKETKNEYLKDAIMNYCSSAAKNKTHKPLPCVENNELESVTLNEKHNLAPVFETCNYNPAQKTEASEISNSPFTEDNSDDSKRSKNSIKMKLKFKRLTTRNNEERIVVVDKELEGVDTESDENENKRTLAADETVLKSSNNAEVNQSLKICLKTLGTKGLRRDSPSLNTKFKCPLLIENKKIKKPVADNTETPKEENFKEKIPKFRYKPFLANITRDLLSESECSIPSPLNEDSPKNISAISPKKKSPLKNAQLIKMEFAQLNELASETKSVPNSDAGNINLKCPSSDMFVSGDRVERKLSTDEINAVDDKDFFPSTQCKLRDRKTCTSLKVPPRRNSLRCQNFKQYFSSDDEDNAVGVASPHSDFKEKFDCFLPHDLSTFKPCTVDVKRLSAYEVEKYISKPIVSLYKSDALMACEPLVASFPSPVIDSKSADSYIDPRKIFENLFAFSSPSRSHSPINFNTFETVPLIVENDLSCGPLSNENSEHSRKEVLKPNFITQNPLKPCDVFKSVERDDMGVLWNLAYLSPPQSKPHEKIIVAASAFEKKTKRTFDEKCNSLISDELQKLAKQANETCSLTYNSLEYESENSLSELNRKNVKVNLKDNIPNTESKITFENILEKNIHNVLGELENIPSFSQTLTDFEAEQTMSCKSETLDTEKEISHVIKEEPKSDPVFEPTESLPNVRILDFQECLVESDSEMNPLLNDSEIDSVMSSADMILSSGVDTQNFEESLQADITFDNHSLSIESTQKCASEEPRIDDTFVKSDIDSNLQKQLDSDLTCNDAIITAADTSSVLIRSLKNNTIPMLAINNPCQEAAVNFATFEEENLNDSQFFPVALAPVPVVENAGYIDNAAVVVKENEPDPQECVNFLDDNELLQSCSVSSTSDIENKNAQASNVLSIPFNGEEDILSMIVKSCDIGEEFDVNMSSVEESEGGSMCSATLCDNLVESNYVMPGSNFIISSQPEQTSLRTNSENTVSSSSENNLLQKNPEIVVIKTEPIDVPDAEHIVYEIQDKSLAFSQVNKTVRTPEDLGHDDDVLLDSMIHSFYGEDSLYGLHSSANNDCVSLLCPTYQNNFSQDTEKLAIEGTAPALKSSIMKTADNITESSSYKSDNYLKNISASQKDSFHFKTAISSDTVPLNMLSNPLFVAHSFPKVSSKRFHFTPTCKPPTREFIEKALRKEIGEHVELNTTPEDDSLSSDCSLSSQTKSNDSIIKSLLKKASLNERSHQQFQNSHNFTKNTSNCDAKVLINSPVLYQDRTKSNLSFKYHFASTPSTSNIRKELILPDTVVSPINKESTLTADTTKRKRKLVFEDDAEGPVKMFKSGRDKIDSVYNKYARAGSMNRTSVCSIFYFIVSSYLLYLKIISSAVDYS